MNDTSTTQPTDDTAVCHYCSRPWHFPQVVFSADGSEAVGEPICSDCAAQSIADGPDDDHGYYAR